MHGHPATQSALVLHARASAFYAGLVVATLVFAPIAVLGLVLPYRVRYAIVVRWATLMVWWLRVTCRLDHTGSRSDHHQAGKDT